MLTRLLSGLACALVLSTTANAQDSAPEKLNALYFHPSQISSMAIVAGMPLDLGMIYLQTDYERYLKPGLSGFGSFSYFSLYPTGSDDGEGDLGFLDLKGGVRLYPSQGFSGFYVQPVINYNRMFLSVDDDFESFDVAINRFGVMAYLGFNGKWDMITVDWNVGLGYLGHGDVKYTVVDKVEGTEKTRSLEDEDAEAADYLLVNPTFGTNFAVGFQF